MKSVKEIVKELKVFERDKIPLEIKILGIATYVQFNEEDGKNPFRIPSCFSQCSSQVGEEA